MRSIGILQGIRKEKHAERDGTPAFVAASLAAVFQAAAPVAVLLASLTLCLPGIAEAREDKQLGTRNKDSEIITRDPATGDRIMRTPEPVPQPEYQGPQTIIVSPEVYPGGRQGGDNYYRPPQRPGDNYFRPPQRPGDDNFRPPQRPGDNYFRPPLRPDDNYFRPPQRPGDNYFRPPQRPGDNYFRPPQRPGDGNFRPPQRPQPRVKTQ